MSAWFRTYRSEAVTVTLLVVLAMLPVSVVAGLPGPQVGWVLRSLVQAVNPDWWINGVPARMSAPFGVIRAAALAGLVLVALSRVRAGEDATRGQRLALSTGAGALGAAFAAAVTAPVMIPALGRTPELAELSVLELFVYVLLVPAVHFGLFAGVVVGLVRGLPATAGSRTATAATSGTAVTAATLLTVFRHRRNLSMPSLSDGPRRRYFLAAPLVTSAAAWAAPDVTRTLCAAVRIDRRLRLRVLRLLADSPRRTVIACPGVDLRPVLQHAVDAEQRDQRRDLSRLGATAVALVGLFTLAGVGAPFAWMLLLVLIVSAGVVLELRHHRDAEGLLASLHEGQAEPGSRRVPVPRSRPSRLLTEGLAAIERAQQGNVTVSAGLGPVQGMGELVDSWMLALPLRPADPPALPGLALTRGDHDGVRPFEDAELVAVLRERLARLSPPGLDGGASGFDLEERLFVNGGSVRDSPALLPEIGEPVRLLLSPAELSALDGNDPRIGRRYLVCRGTSWNGHVMTATLLRLRTEGEILHLHCLKMVERPVRARYRSVVSGGTGSADPSPGFILARSVQTASFGFLVAPVQLAARVAESLRRKGLRRAEVQHAYSERDFDYGGLDSVRTLASAGEDLTHYQQVDVSAQLQLVEKTVLVTVTDFLEARGFDTSELRTYQTLMLNQGIIQTGGVSTVGNQAVGMAASVAASRAAVVTSGGRPR